MSEQELDARMSEKEAGRESVEIVASDANRVSATEDAPKEITGEAMLPQDNASKETPKKEITEEEFMNNEENKAGALSLAVEIINLLGESKWFTVPQLMQKSGMDRMQTVMKLQMLKQYKHAAYRVGDENDKRKYKGEPLWCVAITEEDKIKALDQIIDETLQHIAILNRLYIQRKFLWKTIAARKKADPIS